MGFFQSLDQFRHRIALRTETEEVTYDEMLCNGDRIANLLEERSLVFVLCRSSVESVTGYVGLMRRRAVPVLVNERINPELLSNLLESYRPQWIYTPKEECGLFSDAEEVLKFGDYRLLKTRFEKDFEISSELALLLTTSGSTGSPKLVRQSEKNIDSNTRSIVEYLEISGTDRAITTMPMSYTYGLSILQSHLYCGASVILTERSLMEKQFWFLLKEKEATTFGGVPYTYEMLKKLRFHRMDLPSMKYLTQAGGKLAPELSAEFSALCREKGMKFIVMYGQTEATARMAYLPWEFAEAKAGSMGVAIPGGRFSLEDAQGRTVTAPDTVGELVYSGDNVTLGYASSRFDLNKEDENGGTLHTGDMAKFDEDGFYYIVGRKKRFLKLFGNRVNLDEIEGILRSVGFDCACTGVDDQLQVYTTAKEKEAVLARVCDVTNIHSSGFEVISIPEIPRNDSGKILYSALDKALDS